MNLNKNIFSFAVFGLFFRIFDIPQIFNLSLQNWKLVAFVTISSYLLQLISFQHFTIQIPDISDSRNTFPSHKMFSLAGHKLICVWPLSHYKWLINWGQIFVISAIFLLISHVTLIRKLWCFDLDNITVKTYRRKAEDIWKRRPRCINVASSRYKKFPVQHWKYNMRKGWEYEQ